MEEPGTLARATDARRSVLVGALLVALVLGVYVRALGATFLWDDREVALQWPQELVRRGALWTGPFTERGGYYRPLVSASYWADAWLFGQEAAGFHLTNLLAHAVVTLLVLALGRRLGGSLYSSAACAGLWAVLPRLTESVTWVSGRTDVFMAAFALGGFLLWPRQGAPGWRRRSGSLVLLACALGSKETGMAALLAVLALEWLGSGPLQRRIVSTAALVTLGAAFWVVRSRALAGFDVDVDLGGPSERAHAVADALGSATLALLEPLRPSTILGTPGDVHPLRIVLGGLGVLALGGLGAGAAWARRGDLFAGWVLGAGALLAPLPWLPNPVTTSYADRFLYLPTAIAMASLASAYGGWSGSVAGHALGRPAALLAAVAFAVFAWATNARITDYQDPARFWTKAVVHTEGKRMIALRNLGAALQERLELSDAELAHRAALALHARGVDAFIDTMPIQRDLANTLALQGKIEAALDERLALAMRDGRPESWLDVARCALVARRFDQAAWALSQPGVRGAPQTAYLSSVLADLRHGAEHELWEPDRAVPSVGELYRRVQIAEALAWHPLAVDTWLRIAMHPAASSAEAAQACAVLCRIGDLDALGAAVARFGTAFPGDPSLSVLRGCVLERAGARRAALELRRAWAPFVPGARGPVR